MRLDNIAAKLALYIELYAILALLCLPFNNFGPYSRGMLEKQIIGTHYLLSGGMQMPEEAERHYSLQGKIILALFAFFLIQQAIDIVKELLR